jgi:hypothetical protein
LSQEAGLLPENRCVDLSIGQKILSYDLLQGEEKRLMDAHLEVCAACRDFHEQVFGNEGALDELNYRAWKLGRRQNVPAHQWFARRLQDLWLPFFLVLLLIAAGFVLITTRSSGRGTVRVRHFAVTRAASVETGSMRVDPGPNGFILRTDRDARVYVYEVREGTMRRLVPGETQPQQELTGGETREVTLPPTAGAGSRFVVVLVPSEAPGTTDEWDAAVFADLARGGSGGSGPVSAWPGGMRPTLRWYP